MSNKLLSYRIDAVESPLSKHHIKAEGVDSNLRPSWDGEGRFKHRPSKLAKNVNECRTLIMPFT